MICRRRGAGGGKRASRLEVPLLARHQRQNAVQRHRLLLLIQHLHIPHHHAVRAIFGGFLRLADFLLQVNRT